MTLSYYIQYEIQLRLFPGLLFGGQALLGLAVIPRSYISGRAEGFNVLYVWGGLFIQRPRGMQDPLNADFLKI